MHMFSASERGRALGRGAGAGAGGDARVQPWAGAGSRGRAAPAVAGAREGGVAGGCARVSSTPYLAGRRQRVHAKMQAVCRPTVVRAVAEFLGKGLSEAQVETIVDATRFERMKLRAGDFMRKGRVGDWRSFLSDEQSRRVDEWVQAHTEAADALPLEYD